MSKLFNKLIGVTIGIGAAAAAAYTAYTIKREMDAMPCESSKTSDKTKQWFKMKKDAFKEQIDSKNEKINEIIKNVKEKIVEESSAEKRKELMEKASEQIKTIKAEINDLMHARTKELSFIAHKISDSELLCELTDLVSGAGKSIKEKINISGAGKSTEIENCCEDGCCEDGCCEDVCCASDDDKDDKRKTDDAPGVGIEELPSAPSIEIGDDTAPTVVTG